MVSRRSSDGGSRSLFQTNIPTFRWINKNTTKSPSKGTWKLDKDANRVPSKYKFWALRQNQPLTSFQSRHIETRPELLSLKEQKARTDNKVLYRNN